MDIEEIIENFQFLEDWDDRYKYLIELGDQLPPFPPEEQIAQNKVLGCVSQVWLVSDVIDPNAGDPILQYRSTSDAHIVSGLVAIALAIFSDKPATQILKIDERAVFDEMELSQHITPQRSNGLSALVKRIKTHAQNALKNTA